MTDRPALFIANANSRRGNEVEPFTAALEQGGIKLRRENFRPRDEMTALIASLKDDISAVIVAGGDGTLNAAAGGLRETGLPLGILPLGTANDLARTLDIPSDPAGAAGIVLSGRTRALDLGDVNGVPFFNVASLGLAVSVTQRLNRAVKRRFGVLAYPLAAGIAIIRTGRFRATLRVDGEEIAVTSLQIAVGNGRYYGGGMVTAEHASITDGTFDVYSLEPRWRLRLLLMARAFRAGEHGRLDEVRNLRCRTLTVTTRRPRGVSADGEIVTRTPAHFAVLPGAVRVFVP